MPYPIHVTPCFIRGGICLPTQAADLELLGSRTSRHDDAQDDLQQLNSKALQKGHGDFPRHSSIARHVKGRAVVENSPEKVPFPAEKVGTATEEAR